MSDRVGQQLGNYRLVSLLGTGGFAEVYLGEHVYLKSKAALKLLHTRLADEDQVHFLAEARLLVNLIHPHIVRVLEFGVEGNLPFLVMDYAVNGSLRQRHPRGTVLPLPIILSYVKQIADALQFAHDQKLIHRDIKPENMLLGRRNEVLLSDFGLALLAQSSRSQSTQELAGTAFYMAPEQFQGKPRLASDQYALGIVVYEWLSGNRPFHGSYREIAGQHLFVPPPPLQGKTPAITPAIEQVVLTALAKDPKQRFGSVRAFAEALELAVQSGQDARTFIKPRHQSAAPLSPHDLPLLAPSDDPVLSQPSPLVGEGTPASQTSLPMELARLSTPSPVSPDVITPRKPPMRGISRGRAILFIGLTLLVIMASLGLFFVVRNQQIATDNAYATATARAKSVTAAAQANASATMDAALTATASANPYPPNTGRLLFSDPLSQPLNWAERSDSDGSGCHFLNEAYHVTLRTAACSYSTNHGKFVFEVQMTIVTGQCGAIGGGDVDVNICRDGTYGIYIYSNSLHNFKTVKTASSSAIKQGLNQNNLVALVVTEQTITAYVNHQQIEGVQNNEFDYHAGGFFLWAGFFEGTSEIIYRNARGWLL